MVAAKSRPAATLGFPARFNAERVSFHRVILLTSVAENMLATYELSVYQSRAVPIDNLLAMRKLSPDSSQIDASLDLVSVGFCQLMRVRTLLHRA